ncbi:hypothetical protein ACFSX9_05430 [Flavobacterium ardleyense]|uniref:DUF5673 domain-containing protein n=1 Tax=Flavobacterium ardleyense TaxID=2038737 RepID=A0ABW5Z698_9FLAO
MKRIKFTELGFKKNFDTLIAVLGFVLFIIGMVASLGYSDEKYATLVSLSAIFILFPHIKNFFYKNYFLWNKKGGNIKINSKSKNIVFSELDFYEFNENKLSMIKKNKTNLEFSLLDIHQEDILKLKEILEKYIKKQ